MIRITTGRRLHFGLFTPVPIPELNLAYGGIGAMVDTPGIILQAQRSNSWVVHGTMAERAKTIVEMLRQNPWAPSANEPLEIEIKTGAPAHQGWGTGTQLALAIARAWAHFSESKKWDVREAATWVGRGLRSGIGVAGFDQGGFLIDMGKTPHDPKPSEVQHLPLPRTWTWLLITPLHEPGVFGEAELAALAKISNPDKGVVKELLHLGQDVLAQAVRDQNFSAVAETLSYYNRLAGSFYREVQGGDYGSPAIENRISQLKELGAVGVGQSSWGPGVFCLFPNLETASEFQMGYNIDGCSTVLCRTAVGTICKQV